MTRTLWMMKQKYQHPGPNHCECNSCDIGWMLAEITRLYDRNAEVYDKLCNRCRCAAHHIQPCTSCDSAY